MVRQKDLRQAGNQVIMRRDFASSTTVQIQGGRHDKLSRDENRPSLRL